MDPRYTETHETWNKLALLYQQKFMNLDLYNETYDRVCMALPGEKSKLLEIGCGPGNITQYLLAKRPDLEILGIDVAPNMIELAKKNNPSARFQVMDCRNLLEIRSTFDGILCGFCLPYLSHSDGQKFIADCCQLLKEEGLLYLSFVEGEPERSGYQVSSSGERTYFYFYTLEFLTDLLQQNHFEKVQVFKVKY
ncbi:MAG TPA: class I SAM-dependent methyltransferase, partial [Catalimonadaceae bacterium]|nr:class I SAM-dependent methyltransferase [Catalimonadaceae bacterium]